MTKIPKVIHYCWFGGSPLPELAEKCIESWKKYCPDYEIIRWDENNFDINCNQYVKEAYEARKWAFVTDFVRLYTVYKYGGIYLDTDVELLKSLDDLLDYSGFIGFENREFINTGLGFGASKNNGIIYQMLADYKEIPFIKEDGTYDLTTCPHRNTKALIKKGLTLNNSKQIIDNVIFLPIEFLNPKEYETGRISLTDNTYSIHHFSSSWHTAEYRKWEKKRIQYRKMFGNRFGRILLKLESTISEYGFWGSFKKVTKKIKTVRLK